MKADSDKARKYKPISGADTPRFIGIATFMRLPHVPLAQAVDVDIGLIGVPWDAGATNRAGARHGPRQVREMSALMREVHPVTRVKPYEMANCADLGDVEVNPTDLHESLARIEQFHAQAKAQGIVPLSVGGDHLLSLPVMRAICRDGPLGMVHIDAHTDTNDSSWGTQKLTHGTPFRRAIEEGLLDPKRTVQIAIRGTLYSDSDLDWGLAQGIRVITIEEFHDLGLAQVLDVARRVVGAEPTYLSFDVDALDPAFTPGTGTPEVGGLTTIEAQRLLRGLRGIDVVAADVVEVSPPFDQSGNTALVAASMMFEILCLLAEQVAKRAAS
jgi:guanidinopropionase